MDVRFPIGELELPNQVSLVDVKRWMSEVERYIDQLKNVVNGISEEELKKRYREGSWTVRQLVHHIADSQLQLFSRLKLALTEEIRQHLSLIKINGYLADSELPIEVSIQLLEVKQTCSSNWRNVTEEQLDRQVNLVEQVSSQLDSY